MKILGLLAALGAAALVAGSCGGSDSHASYRDVLTERYPPLGRSLDAAAEPCLAEDFPVCRKQSARARAAARQLVGALSGADVPEGLEQADRRFRHGLRTLADDLDRTLAAIDAADEDALASLRTCCSGAGVDVSNAVGVFNQELDLDLEQ